VRPLPVHGGVGSIPVRAPIKGLALGKIFHGGDPDMIALPDITLLIGRLSMTLS